MSSCISAKRHVCCTRIENLSVKGGDGYILKDVNLHLHCGELTAIVGRNGAGKTTFIKALLNTIPHAGNIIFEGEKCADPKCTGDHTIDHSFFCKCRQKVRYMTTKPTFGYVPQSLSVDAGSPLSVEDLVRSCMSNRPVWLPPRKSEIVKAKEILRMTNADGLLSRRVCDLSGGELQRVLLALAINPVPDILLLDEPVSGVDRVGLKAFYELVSSLRRDFDVTILLISHDLDLVSRHADRVVFLNNAGAIVGKVDEVYRRKEFVECFGRIMLPSECDDLSGEKEK